MNRAPTPTHLRASFLGLALIGGTLGTAAREALSLMIPRIDGVPVATFAINVLGAFLLGLLLESLARRGPGEGAQRGPGEGARRGPGEGARRRLRVLVGTGFLGGFTTYSALATDAADLIGQGAAGAGIGYGLATVVLGGLATWAGIGLGVTRHREPSPAPASEATSRPGTASRLGAPPRPASTPRPGTASRLGAPPRPASTPRPGTARPDVEGEDEDRGEGRGGGTR